MALVDGSGRQPAADRFDRLVAAIRDVPVRPEVVLDEVPAPSRLATHAAAFSAEVLEADTELGSGRLVLLHEPTGHDAWDGDLRLVTFVKATIEQDVVDDPLLPEVAWSWVLEALESHEAVSTALGGTVTQVTNQSFGALRDHPRSADVEIRASWTPLPDHTEGGLGTHARAWVDLLCTAAGLPPLPDGVVALPRPRLGR